MRVLPYVATKQITLKEQASEQWEKTAEVSVGEQIIFFFTDVHLIEYSEARIDEDVDESAT